MSLENMTTPRRELLSTAAYDLLDYVHGQEEPLIWDAGMIAEVVLAAIEALKKRGEKCGE